MGITADDVKHIAALSRLQLSDEESEVFGRQLNDILHYVDQLNELDTTNIDSTSHVLPLNNVFREDIETSSIDVTDALMNAPDRANGFYRVPKIIE